MNRKPNQTEKRASWQQNKPGACGPHWTQSSARVPSTPTTRRPGGTPSTPLGGRYALAHQSEWGRLQRARDGATTAAGLLTPPTKTALDASASAFGQKVEKLHRTIFNEIRPYRRSETNARACEILRGDPRRRGFVEATEGKVSLQFFTSTPMRHFRFTAQEYNSSASGLPQSRLKSILG